MLKRTVRTAIVGMFFLVVTFGVIGYASGSDRLETATRGASIGFFMSLAIVIFFVFRTLDARTPEARDEDLTAEEDSVERQVFIRASSRTFVDAVGVLSLTAALSIFIGEVLNAQPVSIGLLLVILGDFCFRYVSSRRKLVGEK